MEAPASISDARIAANRLNAQSSTGPVTTEGKARSARNSTSHGMTSSKILLADESEEDYDNLVASTLSDLAPRSEREQMLALNVANTIWRRDRIYRTEAATLDLAASQLRSANPAIRSHEEARAHMLLDPGFAKQTHLLLRYVTAAERACEKAAKEYREAVAQRPVEKPSPKKITVPRKPESGRDYMSPDEVVAFGNAIDRMLAGGKDSPSFTGSESVASFRTDNDKV